MRPLGPKAVAPIVVGFLGFCCWFGCKVKENSSSSTQAQTADASPKAEVSQEQRAVQLSLLGDGRTSPLPVAMVLWRGETDSERGFQAVLKESQIEVDFTKIDGNKSKKALATALRAELSENLDKYRYVYSFGTTASTMSHALLKGRVPHLFSIVTNPVKSKLVPSLSQCGPNTCGSSHGIDLRTQLMTARKVVPFEKLGYLFNPREANSNFVRRELKRLAPELGFSVVDMRLAPLTKNLEEDLLEQLKSAGDIDAVYLPLDSFLASNAKTIAKVLVSKELGRKIPSIGAQREYIQSGALLGLVPDYYKLGRKAAEKLLQHLDGVSFESMSVSTETSPSLILNQKTLELLEIEIPDEMIDKISFL